MPLVNIYKLLGEKFNRFVIVSNSYLISIVNSSLLYSFCPSHNSFHRYFIVCFISVT